MLLAASVAARLVWTYLVPNGANFVDLHVYIGGAAALDHPGSLYSYVYADQTPDFPLPFTYPPFAALVFYPLTKLPFGVVAFAWQGVSSLDSGVASFNLSELVDFVLDLVFDWGRSRTCDSDRDRILFRRDKAPSGFGLVVTGSFAMTAFSAWSPAFI